MNSTIYIFGNMQNGYTQYPDDETTHEIFEKFIQYAATAPTVLATRRDGALIYYGYTRQLQDGQSIGLCVLLNSRMMTGIDSLFSLFERGMQWLAEQGYLIKFAPDGNLISNADHLYMSKAEVETVATWIQQEFQNLENETVSLPPVNYTRGIDFMGRFSYQDDVEKIVESTHSNGYTFVRKDKGFNTVAMDSYKGVLEAVNTENEALKRQLVQMQAEIGNTASVVSSPTQVEDKKNSNRLRNLVIAFVVVALVLIGYISYRNVHSSETVNYPYSEDVYDDDTANEYVQQTRRRTFTTLLDQGYVYLKGTIGNNLGVTMYLKFYRNDAEGDPAMGDMLIENYVEGIMHYDSSPADAVLRINGSFETNGRLFLFEYDGNRQTGEIDGTLDGDSFNGSFVAGKSLSFTADVQDNGQIPSTYDKLVDALYNAGVSEGFGGEFAYQVLAFTDKKVISFCDHTIRIEDVRNETSSEISISSDLDVLGYMCKDQKVTFIMQTTYMNGGLRGVVAQYNIVTGKWTTLAEEIVAAEFIDNGTKVKITDAECVGYDGDDYYGDYDYVAYGGYWKYKYRTINL